MTSEAVIECEADQVLRWRAAWFLDLGVTLEDAMALAASAADLHLAERMIEQGCAPELLIRILL